MKSKLALLGVTVVGTLLVPGCASRYYARGPVAPGNGDRYWRAERRQAVWVPGHWVRERGRSYWRPGYWR